MTLLRRSGQLAPFAPTLSLKHITKPRSLARKQMKDRDQTVPMLPLIGGDLSAEQTSKRMTVNVGTAQHIGNPV